METPKEYYYTYYSYEEWGRGYIGSRGCKCLPEDDVKYFGSFSDRTFKPKQKIILKSDYATREEAYADEIILQQHYKVIENPHFANKSYQTSTKFYISREQAIENGKKGGTRTYELGVGVHSITYEERLKIAKKSIEIQRKNNIGFFGMTTEQKSAAGKNGSSKNKKNKVGIFSMTTEELSSAGKKGGKIGGSISGKKNYENGIGLVSITKEERKEIVAKTNSQKWMCIETGHITTSGPLTIYQRARGIDTSKRKKIS